MVSSAPFYEHIKFFIQKKMTLRKFQEQANGIIIKWVHVKLIDMAAKPNSGCTITK